MRIINALNVNDAYRAGLKLLAQYGAISDSRNGSVRMMHEPVTTVYSHPTQRVLFGAQRDANPFFHLFEALWMLAGRNDLATVALFLPHFTNYSDDGKTLHGAYGHRWRRHFGTMEHSDTGIGEMATWNPLDQLQRVIELLRKNPNDRRVMIQIWDAVADLGVATKDAPCNTMVNVQVVANRLNIYVFNRSNDIVWGCYGANAVQFSMLQEYLAAMIGVDAGYYEQISCNWHAYEKNWDQYYPIDTSHDDGRWLNPYLRHPIVVKPLVSHLPTFDAELQRVVDGIKDYSLLDDTSEFKNTFFTAVCYPMLQAFKIYRDGDPLLAAKYLETLPKTNIDWLVAGQEWLLRRKPKKA